MSDVYPIRDMKKNLRVLGDQGFDDWHVKDMPVAHLRKHIEWLAEKRVEHKLNTLAHLVLRLTLVLHVAPAYDDWENIDSDLGYFPFRRVGTMTRMVKVDKGARRVLKSQGHLERKQGYLECGRPYGTGLVGTKQGCKRACELVEITPALCEFEGIEDERMVDRCLDSVKKFGAHFVASLYDCITPPPGRTAPAQKWKTPRELAAMWGVHDNYAPLVSGGLSKLADMALVVKNGNKYRGAKWDCPAKATDWRGACAA